MLTFDGTKHEYRLDGVIVPSVTQILQSEGFIDTSFYDDYSRTRGTYAHQACELYDKGELDETSLDPVIVPYLEAWKKFREETHFEIEGIEERVSHKHLLYAGTYDRSGTLNRGRAIIDIKTGNIEVWTALQTAAYALTYTSSYYGLDRYAVQLKDNGKYILKHFVDRPDFDVWQAIMACYWWKQNNLKGRK